MTTRALRSALLLVCFLLPASPAAAATFTVTSAADGGDANPGNSVCATNGGQCTLRAALGEASALPGADTVNLPAATYTLDGAQGELLADSTVTVVGGGARTTVIRAGANRRVMRATRNLTLRGVTLTGGALSGTSGLEGGGILITGGDVALEGVTVRGNAVTSSTNARGGGIAVTGGTLILLDSTVSDNSATGFHNGQAGSGVGGGIYAAAPTTVRRSTVAGNQTQNGAAGLYSTGGGVAVSSTVVFDHVTVAGNASTSLAGASGFRQGGNVYVSGGSTLSIGGSILAEGLASSGQNCFSNGTVTETAKNLADTSDCLGGSSLRNVNPKLGVLDDNGGGTDTRRPAADSPAQNAAANCGARSADQRGNALPAGGACDLGAVENGADRSVTLQASKSAAGAGEDVTLVATIANAGADDATSETLALDLPAGVTATTATSTLGSCTTGATVTCTLGTLARGAAATITATVRASGADLAVTARRGGPLPDQGAANDAASVTVAGLGAPAAPGGAPSSGGSTSVAGDTVAPLLSALKVAPRPTVRRGATLRFRLSEAASVRVVTERLVTGRRAGARCAAKGRGARCTRALKMTTRTARARSGGVSVKVPGRVLKAGRVRFTLVATDAAGNRSKPVRVTVRVRAR